MKRSNRWLVRGVVLVAALAFSLVLASGTALAASPEADEGVRDEVTYQDFLAFLQRLHLAAVMEGVGDPTDLATYYAERIDAAYGPFIEAVTGEECSIATIVWVWHGW